MLRKILFGLILLSQSVIQFSQEIHSKVEPSRLLNIRFYDAGNIDAIEFKIMIITDVIANSVRKVVRLEMIFQNELLMQPKVNEFDGSEIEALRKSCDHILEHVHTQPFNHYVEIIYVCKGGFTVGAFYTPVKQKWAIYLKVNKDDSKSTLHINTDELLYFKNLLGEISKRMDQLTQHNLQQ